MDEPVTGSEELWAEHGLTGLVFFALFSLVAYAIYSMRASSAAERKERGEIRNQNERSCLRLADAIDKLSDELGGRKE